VVKETFLRFETGGAVGLMERAVMGGEQDGEGRYGWDVESPHILADSFRANKNGCRVSQRKDGKCGGVRTQEPEV
jgi:hypothetical protein